jgi:hypothetical protein
MAHNFGCMVISNACDLKNLGIKKKKKELFGCEIALYTYI